MNQAIPTAMQPTAAFRLTMLVKRLFTRFGILPLLLVIVIALFGSLEPRFLSAINLSNVARQSTFLMIIAMAQMMVLITAGMDLSVGALVGLVTVVAGLVMKAMAAAGYDMSVAIGLGIAAGLGVSLLVGMFNGFCVALIGLSPFIATLGTMTALTGIALTISGGLPVGGIPRDYAQVFAIDRHFGLQMPIIITAVVFAAAYFILNRTVLGRYFYAMGSNSRAARLSGINVRLVPFVAYVMCSFVTGIAGLLVLARTSTGGSGVGSEYGLQSVTACVIAGVSLFGGTGRAGGVVLGALFLALLSNGMNILQVQSYAQMIVLGGILIFALIGDRIRVLLIGQKG